MFIFDGQGFKPPHFPIFTSPPLQTDPLFRCTVQCVAPNLPVRRPVPKRHARAPETVATVAALFLWTRRSPAMPGIVPNGIQMSTSDGPGPNWAVHVSSTVDSGRRRGGVFLVSFHEQTHRVPELGSFACGEGVLKNQHFRVRSGFLRRHAEHMAWLYELVKKRGLYVARLSYRIYRIED